MTPEQAAAIVQWLTARGLARPLTLFAQWAFEIRTAKLCAEIRTEFRIVPYFFKGWRKDTTAPAAQRLYDISFTWLFFCVYARYRDFLGQQQPQGGAHAN